MAADLIEAQYEQLEAVSARFRSQADVSADLHSRIRQVEQSLRNGDWEGLGAAAFFSEMDTVVYPGLDRLHAALTSADEVTKEIISILREAEEEAAQPFGASGGDFAGSPSAGSGSVSGATGGDSAGFGSHGATGAGSFAGSGASASGNVAAGDGGPQSKGLLDQVGNINDWVSRLTGFPLLAQDLASGFVHDAQALRRLMSARGIPISPYIAEAILDVSRAARMGVKPSTFAKIVSLADNPALKVLDKVLSPVDLGINAVKFFQDPSVESGADAGASALGVWGAFGSGPGALLAASFAGGYTIGKAVVPKSFTSWVGDKLTEWDPLGRNYTPRNYPRSTITEYDNAGREMPLNAARDVALGLAEQHSPVEARDFALKYAKRNNLDLGDVVPRTYSIPGNYIHWVRTADE